MKSSQDTTLIVAILILVLFAVFTIIYMLLKANPNNNSLTNNTPNDTIYSEHIHNVLTPSNAANTNNIQATYVDIGTYTTKIQDTDANRMYNIKLACKRLDGHIVKAGEEFSFNSTMGNMGASDGYKKALGFDSNGNKIKMYGGGICQISSTLYNAVLAANLKVTERHAHSRRVYYVPKNKDATVFSGGPDFKFKNTTNFNITICTYTDGYTVTVTLKQEQFIENKSNP